MNVRKTVKKIAALSGGALMVGATMMGAMAYDLAEYPAPFIADGVFDGTIVVGASAATQDVIGSIDIAASLQAMAVTQEAVEVPGLAGEVDLGKNAFRFEKINDILEIRESMGNIYDTLTQAELPALATGVLTTNRGTTSYDQYLYFAEDNTSLELEPMGVNYQRDKQRVDADFLVIDNDYSFFKWEMIFTEGLKSTMSIPTGASSQSTNFELEDIEDEIFNIFGTEFTFVNSYVNTAQKLQLDFMTGDVSSTLREGETKTFTIDGVEYEVTLIFVSDPNTGIPEAKFMVNGEVTKSLRDGKTDKLSGGLEIGVRDLLVNSREGVVEFFLGAQKVTFTDENYTNSSSSNNVEISSEVIDDVDVQIDAVGTAAAGNELTINTITYKLEANPEDGNKFYIPAGSGVRDFMDEPEALLSPTFDIRYEGFKSIATSELLMDPLGDDEYELTATNLRGDTFSWPVISNIDGIFRWGDDTDDFVFVEHSAGTEYDGTLAEIAAMIQANATATDFAISEDDYFLLSNDAKKEKAFSYILTYDKSNDGSDKTIVFSDESGGKYTAQYTPDATNALLLGYSDKLIVGGNTYKVWISADKAAGYPVAVDLNGDGKLTNNQRVNFTIYGGGVLDFALGYVATGSPALGAINGNGASIGTANDLSERVRMQLTTVETQFDDPNLGDETVAWNVSANVNEVDFAMGVSDITEPSYLFGTSEFDTITFLKEKGGDISRTYTSYGAYVSRDSPTDSPAVLLIDYPGEEVATQVFVVAGTTTRTESTEGITRDVVNPISVGLAVLDSDAGALGTANMIVVGGPCANTVAAEVMGNPTVCSEGFSPGKAMIKSVETGGKVAILVAGYEAQETQGASYVLANFGDYAAFQGEEVEVVVPDLSNIVVQAVTAAPVEEETPEE